MRGRLCRVLVATAFVPALHYMLQHVYRHCMGSLQHCTGISHKIVLIIYMIKQYLMSKRYLFN